MPPKRLLQNKSATKSKGLDNATTTEKAYFALYDENTAKYGSNTAVLYLVGRFYEMYDYVVKTTGESRTNVQRLAEICGCSVEHKPCTDESYSRLFWGFPMDSLRKFERMLVSANLSVVVYVQEKDAAGGVVGRPFDHVASPGTYCDDDGIQIRREEQCMLAVYVEPWTDEKRGFSYWSVASTAFDVTTGSCESTEAEIQLIDGKPVFDVITPFWSLHPPAEVVFLWCSNQSLPSDQEIASFVSPTTRIPLIHKHTLDSKQEVSTAAERIRMALLEETYKPSSALSLQEYLGISYYPQIKRSLFFLLQFIKEHNPSFLSALHDHTVWQSEKHVLLGNAALQQLGMLPLNSDKPQESLLYWLLKAETAMGRRALRTRMLKPTADVEELEKRQTRIEAYRTEPPTHITGMLRGMSDLERLYRRFQLKTATFQELYSLTTTYEKAHNLLQAIKGKLYDVQEPSSIPHVADFLAKFSGPRILTTISGASHPWQRGIHADLDTYEDQWTTLVTRMTALRASWNELLKEADGVKWIIREEAPFTFIATQRRSTSIVNASKLKHLTVTVRKNGSSKSEYIMETDEIIAANAAAVTLRRDWAAAIQEQLSTFYLEFTTQGVRSGAFAALVSTIGTVDTEYTLAELCQKYGYVRPRYLTKECSAVSIQGLRHPIIERVSPLAYVSHSIRLGTFDDPVAVDAQSSNGILLYGVNAAGKSSLGKALGLAVLMAQTGMPVPAAAMTIAPYTALFTRILGNDNLWAGMSSFVVEMTEFRSILRAANSRTLVIGDELCAGTETASATSIVAAGVEHLAEKEAHFLFATHLHELADIVKTERVAAYHLTVHSDPASQTLIYDRRLKPGCGSPMYGLEVCRGLDMDSAFLERAFGHRQRYFEGGTAHTSRYNATLVVDACAICGSNDRLETHHIVPQAAANKDGKISPERHKNHISNLVPLCDGCHTKHHKGLYDIKGWIMTTAGRRLDYLDIATRPGSPGGP